MHTLSQRTLGICLLAWLLVACHTQPAGTTVVKPSSTPVEPSSTPLSTTTNTAAFTPTQDITPTPTHRTTKTPTQTRTPRNTPTKTLVITKIPALTPTPYPTLSTSGPYLVYLTNTDDGHQALTLLEADGTGRKRLPLPDGAYIASVRDSLSPSGEWFAFHTGSASAEPYDVALHLMHLPDGEISTVAKLLSDEYPANFGPIAKRLLQDYPQDYPSEYYPEDSLAQLLQEIFIFGIHALGWSPDGRYLAFAGQMDGLSSDIYRLDMHFDTITQLTDGPDQIESISWSADGQWILHEASNDPLGMGRWPNVYAVKWDGSHGKKILEDIRVWGWLSPAIYAVYDSQNGIGDYNLRLMDIDTDLPIYSWPGPFESFAFDPDTQIIILLYTFDPADPSPEIGIYIYHPGIGLKYIHSEVAPLGQIYAFGGEKYLFLHASYDSVQGISKEGEITLFSDVSGPVYVSPDRNWILISQHSFQPPTPPEGLYLYTASGELTGRIMDNEPDSVFWLPDSSAFVYCLGTDLYYAVLPGESPVLVDTNIDTAYRGYYGDSKTGNPDFGWIK